MRSSLAGTVSVFALATLCLAMSAAGAEEGTANGKLTVAGKTTLLSHAYARAQKGFFDKSKEDIRVILSDVAIPDEALADEFALQKMAADGKLHAIEVVLGQDKQAVSGGLLHEAFDKTQGYVSVSGMHDFEAKTFDAKNVEGTLSMKKPDSFMNKQFEYSATFRAPVWHRPPPTATGAAAAATAPGKAVLAFLKAARSGNKAALKTLMTAEAGKALDGPRSDDMVTMLKTMAPNPATAQIDEVDIAGNTAKVSVVEKSKDGSATSNFTMVLENGQWKVGGM